MSTEKSTPGQHTSAALAGGISRAARAVQRADRIATKLREENRALKVSNAALLAALREIADERNFPYPRNDRSRDVSAQRIGWERCASIARAAIAKAEGAQS